MAGRRARAPERQAAAPAEKWRAVAVLGAVPAPDRRWGGQSRAEGQSVSCPRSYAVRSRISAPLGTDLRVSHGGRRVCVWLSEPGLAFPHLRDGLGIEQ